ncbi:MAG: hypothetical protein K0U34_00240 [Alphaproteobacteria bacterium]|nr:hypothetical protein [Alphaproteobacteria bacterium]
MKRSMDRRNFLKSVTGAATAVAATAATAEARDATGVAEVSPLAAPSSIPTRRTLRLALAWPDNAQGFSDFCRQFAARVSALTDGTISISVDANQRDGLEAVSRGDADCYCGLEHHHRVQESSLSFFAGLPGRNAMTGQVFHNWLTVGGGQAHWDNVAASLGMKAMAIAHSGPRAGLWSRVPIDSLKALTGRTVFAEGLGEDVVRALGGEVYSGPSDTVSTALADGRLFAAEPGGLMAAVAAGLPTHAYRHSGPGINRHGVVAAFGIRKSIWDTLSDGERAILESAAAANYHETLAFAASYDALMTKACKTQHNIAFEELTREVQDAIDRVSDIIVAHVAASDLHAQQINASYMTFRDASQSFDAAAPTATS